VDDLASVFDEHLDRNPASPLRQTSTFHDSAAWNSGKPAD
jgi:hypothetical protein